jgi:hypothetical protein
MKSKTNIATGLIITSVGVLVSLAEFKHAVFLMGVLISIGGLEIVIEALNKDEHEN